MTYKSTAVFTNYGFTYHGYRDSVTFFKSRNSVAEYIQLVTERYGMDNYSEYKLNGTILIKLYSPRWTMKGAVVPLKDSLAHMHDLKVGDCWRRVNESEGVFRIVQQVGKTEVYSPEQDKAGGDSEVYLRSSNVIIIYTELK